MERFWSTALIGLRDLLAPPCCAACDILLQPNEEDFCGGCAALLEAAPRALQPPADSAALLLYGGPLATAVQRFKYNGRTDLTAALSRLLLAAVPAYAGRVDCVMPVPLHPQRLRERGYNQSALLSKQLARQLGVPLVTSRLVRVRPTSKQANLSHQERRGNVRGAFSVRGRQRLQRVLLVDDVRTSGATLAEAAGTLREAGSPRVYALALAFAQR